MSQLQTLSVSPKEGSRESAVSAEPASDNKGKAADEAKAARESAEETVSTPGGFKNDPDDSTNPNEAIERHRRQLRP